MARLKYSKVTISDKNFFGLKLCAYKTRFRNLSTQCRRLNRSDIEALLYAFVVGIDEKRMFKRRNLPSTVQNDGGDDLYLSVGDGWKPPPPVAVVPPGGQVLPSNLLDFFYEYVIQEWTKGSKLRKSFFLLSHSPLHCISFKVNFCNESFWGLFLSLFVQRWRRVSLEKKWHSRDMILHNH